MPRRKTAPQETHKPGQVGDYWLSERPHSPYWHRTWYDPGRQQTRYESLGVRDFDEAHELLIRWVAQNGRTWEETDPKVVKLMDVLEWYYTSHASKLSVGGSVKIALGYWGSFFGEKAVVADVKRARIDEFTDRLRKAGKSEGYIGTILVHGRSALNRAEKYELLSRAPFIPMNQTVEEKLDVSPMGRPLNVTDMAKLLTLPWPPHLQVQIGIMLNTACRPGAALDLTGAQVDYEYNLVTLNPPGRKQTKKRRPILPMTKQLVRLLQAIEIQARDRHAALRLNTPFEMGHYMSLGGHRLKYTSNGFRAIVDRSDIDKASEITSYSFRHTVARELRAAGVDTEEISVFLGHRPTGVSLTTGIYAPYEPFYLKRAVTALETYVERVHAEIGRLHAEGSADVLAPLVTPRYSQLRSY